LIHLEVDGLGNAVEKPSVTAQTKDDTASNVDSAPSGSLQAPATTKATAQSGFENRDVNQKLTMDKPLASPSVRQKARDLGVELSSVSGSGPASLITHADLDIFDNQNKASGDARRKPDTSVNVVKIVGMRRKIAEKMALSNSRIPHITIVEEVDVHSLEDLREELNEKYADSRGRLTILPFIMKSIVEAVREQPELNAHFDDEAGSVSQFGGVHLGVATQTPNGLVVPVVRHSETNSLWNNAAEFVRLAAACQEGKIEREELGCSTITISSLGPLGALATTPIINHPEVAIIGINKMVMRPHWDGTQFIPRKTMNLSCSFDHRIIDGRDAAVFVQKLKTLLESPAMLLVED